MLLGHRNAEKAQNYSWRSTEEHYPIHTSLRMLSHTSGEHLICLHLTAIAQFSLFPLGFISPSCWLQGSIETATQ